MNIDFDKIEEIYGSDTLELIKDNIDDVSENIKYLTKLRFDDIEDIFERNTLMFICDKEEFKNKVNKLISKLGNNYVELLETNMELWEEIQ